MLKNLYNHRGKIIELVLMLVKQILLEKSRYFSSVLISNRDYEERFLENSAANRRRKK